MTSEGLENPTLDHAVHVQDHESVSRIPIAVQYCAAFPGTSLSTYTCGDVSLISSLYFCVCSKSTDEQHLTGANSICTSKGLGSLPSMELLPPRNHKLCCIFQCSVPALVLVSLQRTLIANDGPFLASCLSSSHLAAICSNCSLDSFECCSSHWHHFPSLFLSMPGFRQPGPFPARIFQWHPPTLPNVQCLWE